MSGSGSGRSRDEGSMLEGSWMWVALPVGVLGLIAALWFLVIAPTGGAPPRATATPARTATAEPTMTLAAIPPPTQSIEPSDEPTAEPTPMPTEPTAIGPGARVEVADTGGAGLRMRQAPGLDGATLKFVNDGTKLVVVGGPEEAGGLTWWKVDDQAGSVGWVAAQYIRLVP